MLPNREGRFRLPIWIHLSIHGNVARFFCVQECEKIYIYYKVYVWSNKELNRGKKATGGCVIEEIYV